MTMQTLETVRQKVSQLLTSVDEVNEAVIRGERIHDGKCFAVAYIDIADDVVGRAQDLRDFQEGILGQDHFNSPGDLRWNKYIYIVAGPKSIAQPDFQRAKAIIEADEDFARKRVVLEEELASALGAAQYFIPSTNSQEFDIVGEWGKLLREASIDGILDRPPRTVMLERINSGNAGSAASPRRLLTLDEFDKHLQERWLSKLRVENFRPVHDGRGYFDFGQVTLITGPNGTGKTSLLEAIEFFYCGQNRRGIAKSAKVYGTLWNSDQEHLATTDSSRLRARCLHWYNREEKNSIGLLNGFGKYNFLDTDAAFRIASELSPDDLSDDLSRLIVGPDASQIWSYLAKLGPEVETAAERAHLYLKDSQKTFEDTQAKLKGLQERPSDARALSEAFRARLAQIGYRGIIPMAPFVSADEAKPLQAAYSALQVLLSSGPALKTLESLESRSRAIDETNAAVGLLDTQVKSIYTQIFGLEGKANSLDSSGKHLKRWAEYVRARYAQIRTEYLRCRDLVSSTGAILGVFANAEVPALDQAQRSVRLVDALNSASQGIQTVSTQIASLEQLSASFDQAATARAQTAQDLKTAVLAVLKSGAPKDTCPVCKTVHSDDGLAAHIERITTELAQPTELTELSSRLSAERETLKQWFTWQAFLMNLEQIALQLSLPNTQTCGEIVAALSSARRNFEQAKANLQPASEALNRLYQAGMSDDEHDSLLSFAAKIPTLTNLQYDIEIVETHTRAYLDSAISLRDQISPLQEQAEQIKRSIELKVAPLFDDGWVSSTTLLAGASAIAHLNEEIVALLKQRNELLLHFDVDPQTKLSDVQVTLTGALRSLNEAVQAVEHEKTASAEIANLLRLLERQKSQIDEHLRKQINLQKASAALSKLISELSLESATAKSLSLIAEEINDAFVRIHSPNEYEYVGSEGVLLRAKENQEDWSLDKVSTGQRAAFAISVFLAVNRTAAKAPPVILIDDPVAHVDDLNALSFLDYLRDLAVTSKKQVFFATADARVAALFTRKFSFLGDNFKRINLAREVQTE